MKIKWKEGHLPSFVFKEKYKNFYKKIGQI